MWCICDIEYLYTEDKNVSPWVLSTLKPIQLSNFDFDAYIETRKKLTTEEWIDGLIQSMGFNPEYFSRRSKLLQLVRLIPYCERNYNLIELGPKGTGKSHIYSEFSPHGILISGGEITVPKLFVNNSNGKVGLVGYWDIVAFDEFAGKSKRVDKALVDIMKNYMANKSFSRGVETLGADASMVFVGNTQHSLAYMLKHSDLFEELPGGYYDSAFLDRLHFYIPGWEMDIIRGEMFSSGYGFVVDYLAEILRTLRNHDFSQNYTNEFKLSNSLNTRDRDGINKTYSGLMKIIFPDGICTQSEKEELLQFAIEGRKRVKTQLMRIDSTFTGVSFSYFDKSDKEKMVNTLEEDEYPHFFNSQNNTRFNPTGSVQDLAEPGKTDKEPFNQANANIAISVPGNMAQTSLDTSSTLALKTAVETRPNDALNKNGNELKEKHITIRENQKGISFDTLFGDYLAGANKIVITDPYIRLLYQANNLMDLIETIAKYKINENEINVHLITSEDEIKKAQQIEYLDRISQSAIICGINFTYEFDTSNSIHARHIITDHGWKILLDRGLDVFQHYEVNNLLSIANRMQKYRPCKPFEVTYLKNDIKINKQKS